MAKRRGGGRKRQPNDNLTTANSAMTPSPGMQHPGRAKNSLDAKQRSSVPTSIMNTGPSKFGPLAYSGGARESQEYFPSRRRR